MRKLFKLLVYASLLFLAYYLARHDFLEIPTVRSYGSLVASLPFLFGGFLAGSRAWQRVLARSGYETSFVECVASMGLSIFTKYIPGKLWLVLGRATYLSERRGYPVGTMSTVSVNDQLIGLWTGLVLGAAGLFAVGGLRLYGWLLLFSWIVLTVLVFSPWAHDTGELVIRTVLRRPVALSRLDLRSTSVLLPWFVGCWISWSIGFLLLVDGLSAQDPAPTVGLAFPLGASLGIMAVIAPGGLGVREGTMTAYLALAGVSLTEATTISVASRIWFLIGEAFFFVSGFVANRIVLRRAVGREPSRRPSS